MENYTNDHDDESVDHSYYQTPTKTNNNNFDFSLPSDSHFIMRNEIDDVSYPRPSEIERSTPPQSESVEVKSKSNKLSNLKERLSSKMLSKPKDKHHESPKYDDFEEKPILAKGYAEPPKQTSEDSSNSKLNKSRTPRPFLRKGSRKEPSALHRINTAPTSDPSASNTTSDIPKKRPASSASSSRSGETRKKAEPVSDQRFPVTAPSLDPTSYVASPMRTSLTSTPPTGRKAVMERAVASSRASDSPSTRDLQSLPLFDGESTLDSSVSASGTAGDWQAARLLAAKRRDLEEFESLERELDMLEETETATSAPLRRPAAGMEVGYRDYDDEGDTDYDTSHTARQAAGVRSDKEISEQGMWESDYDNAEAADGDGGNTGGIRGRSWDNSDRSPQIANQGKNRANNAQASRQPSYDDEDIYFEGNRGSAPPLTESPRGNYSSQPPNWGAVTRGVPASRQSVVGDHGGNSQTHRAASPARRPSPLPEHAYPPHPQHHHQSPAGVPRDRLPAPPHRMSSPVQQPQRSSAGTPDGRIGRGGDAASRRAETSSVGGAGGGGGGGSGGGRAGLKSQGDIRAIPRYENSNGDIGGGDQDVRASLAEKVKELETELGIYRKENAAVKSLRIKQEELVTDASKLKEEAKKWADEERARATAWCEEQRQAAVRDRRAAAKQVKDAQIHLSMGPNRKERAEIEALEATIEKMKIEYEAARKKSKTNERRMESRIKDLIVENQELKNQIESLEQDKRDLGKIILGGKDWGISQPTGPHDSQASHRKAGAKASADDAKVATKTKTWAEEVPVESVPYISSMHVTDEDLGDDDLNGSEDIYYREEGDSQRGATRGISDPHSLASNGVNGHSLPAAQRRNVSVRGEDTLYEYSQIKLPYDPNKYLKTPTKSRSDEAFLGTRDREAEARTARSDSDPSLRLKIDEGSRVIPHYAKDSPNVGNQTSRGREGGYGRPSALSDTADTIDTLGYGASGMEEMFVGQSMVEPEFQMGRRAPVKSTVSTSDREVALNNRSPSVTRDVSAHVQSRSSDVGIVNNGPIPNNLTRIESTEGPNRKNTSSNGAFRHDITVANSQTEITKYRNGTIKEVFPDGRSEVTFLNGDIKTTLPDGRVDYYYAEAKTTHTTLPDGTQIYRFPNNQIEKHHLDGTKEIFFPDKTKKTIHSNGLQESQFPDGLAVKEYPDGTKQISRLPP